MITDEIRAELFRLQDTGYRDFQRRLTPSVASDRFIGVRTPQLREYAGQICGRDDIDEFLRDLPHRYFDENQLHAFIISLMTDFDGCMKKTESFLPYIDNWATCDQLSPKAFKKNTDKLPEHIRIWIRSENTYTVRFGVGMLMQHCLNEHFDPEYPALVAEIRSDEYYINMMLAWYFATALAKRYEAVLPYIEGRKLAPWTHNKAIQKAVESRRITAEKKEYLKTLKISQEDKCI